MNYRYCKLHLTCFQRTSEQLLQQIYLLHLFNPHWQTSLFPIWKIGTNQYNPSLPENNLNHDIYKLFLVRLFGRALYVISE